jgi:hypothetical protein
MHDERASRWPGVTWHMGLGKKPTRRAHARSEEERASQTIFGNVRLGQRLLHKRPPSPLDRPKGGSENRPSGTRRSAGRRWPGNEVSGADRGHRLHPHHLPTHTESNVSGSTRCSITPKTTTQKVHSATITYAASRGAVPCGRCASPSLCARDAVAAGSTRPSVRQLAAQVRSALSSAP